MQLSEKRKIFSDFFFFCKFTFNFRNFQKKEDPHSSRIFGLTDFDRGG